MTFPTDEPALPKKTPGRNKWTEREIDILMSMAAEITAKGERIRWREIAAATGHHESSCALKYHTLRSRAAGRLARELIDADLAAQDPVTPPARAKTGGGAYPVWSPEEDAKLMAGCRGKLISGNAAWEKVAEGFPGRSFRAVRQRYLTLRNKEAGIKTERVRPSRARPQIRTVLGKKVDCVPPAPVEYATITAAFFKDPPPGRSALDKMRAGIADEPLPDRYHTRWEARAANQPCITLATEPMR